MTVAVAVSGGMDSLLSLVLLKEQGEDVMAVHGHFLPPNPDWQRVVDGLTKACETLGVSFHALDLHSEFDQRVVAPFVAAYRAGLTPNPCAMCNPCMKFGTLFTAAQNMGADRFATGHYVRLEKRAGLGVVLTRGTDLSKDQSYFLSLVPIEKLRLAYFPLAETYKRDVLDILDSHGLTPPIPSESQEICFVPDDDYQSFLCRRGKMPGGGQALLSDGTVVGSHKGLWRHTQGQRRGLGIAWTEALYVLDKDIATNTLIVGTREELEAPGCIAGQVNMMVPFSQWPKVVMAQTRYRQKAKPSRVDLEDGKLIFHFIEAHGRPTPGQVAVAYTEDGVVLGGGVIEASTRGES
ncbi:tRNA 2-thiouridine(34) synthase MnmA [Pseudodesulfovibrio piezophilus]|uniref:tRNA-specific 2-thiouridylase MnmA n=1 Tax=Pseudodesulfovibrio piezophilus (strain DSM 21447 / JCM 15486 / C1TLV30) TaxID=1322246 RepID=M1WNN7_PSEP2|nr:tRNA 2-thiouridine(34) synthase MnmA [Pseudodesulfovibrio piezophilus]CCH50470.1 tRNA-specific 2-thiouridylase mnmA [Pseudodesulfovibrio piezophilus C1TLV30]